jgi:hypothetical protein
MLAHWSTIALRQGSKELSERIALALAIGQIRARVFSVHEDGRGAHLAVLAVNFMTDRKHRATDYHSLALDPSFRARLTRALRDAAEFPRNEVMGLDGVPVSARNSCVFWKDYTLTAFQLVFLIHR